MRKFFLLSLAVCLVTAGIEAQTPDEHYYKGLKLYRDRNYKDAIIELTKATDAKPDYVDAWYLIGLSKYVLMDTSAIEEFSKVIALKPDHDKAYGYIGMIKFYQDDYTAAISYFNKSIELNSNNPVAYYIRGQTRKEMKDYDGALKDLNKAISLKEDYVEAYYQKGWTEYLEEDYQTAIADFNKTISFNNSEFTGVGYYFRGLCEFKMEMDDDACRDFRTALDKGYKDAAAAIKDYCQ